MSLYGSGRREGITAALSIAAATLAVHLLAALATGAARPADAAAAAALPGLGGLLCYRFLRAQGRSRFAAFLAGACYALSPWLLAQSSLPREQVAGALAPLALEAAARCGRPDQRRTWLPWLPLCLAAPFAGGACLTAWLAAVLACGYLLRTLAGCSADERAALRTHLGAAAALAAVAAGSLWAIDPFGPWLSVPAAPTAAMPLHAGRDSTAVDLPSLLRFAGPVLLVFCALGVLRRQRHASVWRWLALAAAGALPSCAAPWYTMPATGPLAALPAASWWLTLVGVTVLGAAGLDDFLDLPLRRRTALPWLLALAVAGAPLVALASREPAREWPLTATVLLFALLLPSWRRIGILRFKNVLATATLLALAVPALQLLPVATPAWRAAPAGETAPGAGTGALQALLQRPPWHYSGLALVFAACIGAACVACWRSRKARTTPASAVAAIRKKARPASTR